MNDCLEASTKSSTEITIEMESYDDLTTDPPLKFIVDIDSPISSFIEFLNDKFTIPPDIVSLFYNGNKVSESSTFAENNIKDGDKMRIEFEAKDFDTEKANQTLLDSAVLLAEIQKQAALFQISLNEENIENANEKLQQFATFCEGMIPKIREKSETLPKRY